MLYIQENNIKKDATVVVQSRTKPEQTESENIFTLDYEDYLNLKDWHFYSHQNGSFITRKGEKQINLNRIIAWSRGYYDY